MNVQELTLTVNGAPMDYIRFGSGKKTFIIVAGMSLASIRGLGEAIADGYQMFAEEYTVYAFDRRREIPAGFTVQDMAEDLACALTQLGITQADFMGFSLGGMLTQCLAMDHPELVRAAVLCATACCPTPTSRENFPLWIDAARTGDVEAVNLAFYRRIWTEQAFTQYESLLPTLLGTGTPEQCPGFAALAEACLTFDRAAELGKIRCPVLVIGVRGDKIFSGEASEYLAEKLGCALHMYEGYGHAVCDEAPDFKERILRFYHSIP